MSYSNKTKACLAFARVFTKVDEWGEVSFSQDFLDPEDIQGCRGARDLALKLEPWLGDLLYGKN